MKVKTSKLKDDALAWAVAKCQGAGAALVKTHSRGEVLLLSDNTEDCDAGEHYHPQTNWAQGGPIIERENISITGTAFSWWECEEGWYAHVGDIFAYGDTPLVAAMRAYVASKLGDEVEIPEELK